MEISQQERELLSITSSLKTMQMGAGYKKLREVMGQWVEEAQRDALDCISSHEQIRSNLLTRWQERKRFVVMVDSYLRDSEDARKELIRQIAVDGGNTAVEAYDIVEALENNNG